MNRTRNTHRRATLSTFAALFMALPALLHGQQLTWVGGASGTNSAIRLGSNWSTNMAPNDDTDLYIAFTANTVIPTLLVNDVMSARSFTFDNAAGKFNPTNGLRIAATTSNSNSVQGYIFFNTATTIVTALNNANASFRGGSVTGNSTANPLPSLTLDLNYSGLGTIDVQDTSIVLIAEGSNNVPGATAVGIGGINKVGTGILRLNGNHTYSGGFQLSEGIVEFSASGSVTDGALTNSPFGTGALTLSGGTLRSTTDAGRTVYSNINLGGFVTITTDTAGRMGNFTMSTTGGGATTLITDSTLNISQTVNWNQDIGGGHSLTKVGAGTLSLNGVNSYSGGTIVSEGLVRGDTGSLQGGIVNNASIEFSQTTDGTYAGNMSGSGSVSLSGTGMVAFTGTNSYSGGTTVSDGTLAGTTSGLQGSIANNAAMLFDQSGNGTFTGSISGTGTVAKSGAGNVTLSGPQAYSGNTLLNAGTLTAGGASSLGSGSIIFAGGTLGYGAGVTTDFSSRFATGSAAIAIDTAGNNVTFATAFDNTQTGGLVKSGSGVLTLTGANTYTGGTTVTGGTLRGDSTSLQGNIATTANVQFDQATDGTYASNLSGTGTLTKTGAGKLTLAGSTAHTGTTTVQQGTLQVDTVTMVGNLVNDALVIFDQLFNGQHAGNISGLGTLQKSGGGTVRLTGTNTYSGGTSVLGGTLEGDSASLQGSIANSAAVTFNQSSDGTYASVMSGTGSFSKTGSGALTLTGANTYSGGTTISGGSLVGTTSSLQGDFNNQAGLVFNQTSNGTFNGSISGNGTLTKLGAGTLTLDSFNSFSGATTISAGALHLSQGYLGGSVSVAPSAQLSGTGHVAGDTFISGVHAPGEPVGIQSFGGNLTYQSGAHIHWQLIDNTSQQPLLLAFEDALNFSAANFDQIIVGGDLNIAGATLLTLSFNAAGSLVDWFDPFWDTNQQWELIVMADNGSITNFSNLSLSPASWIDNSGRNLTQWRDGAAFTLASDGEAILLSYTAAAIPEPSTYAALLGLAALGLVAYRRHRQRRAAA